MMRRLNQTTYHELEAGNCFATCIACIADLDPQNLPRPHRRVLDDQGAWEQYLADLFNVLWYEHRITLSSESNLRPAPEGLAIATYRIVAPNILRGILGHSHAVVVEHGELLWDPNPFRRAARQQYERSSLVDWIVVEREETG